MDKLTCKERHKIVSERSRGLCEVCGSPYMVQHHHIIQGKGCRTQCETIYSLIALCWHCHHGTNGVHGKNGRELNIKLKVKLQEVYFKKGYNEDEIREMMGGKLYEM